MIIKNCPAIDFKTCYCQKKGKACKDIHICLLKVIYSIVSEYRSCYGDPITRLFNIKETENE